jgi:hypothetical protein
MTVKSSTACRLLLPLLCIALTVNGQSTATGGPLKSGGSACVIAKKLGDSLAIEWAVGEPTVGHAMEKAKQALHAKGYEYVFPQSNSSNQHGWMIIVKTRYRTYTGRERTSYGCGFSNQSPAAAETNALLNLRTYSWGWKESSGYEVIEKHQY